MNNSGIIKRVTEWINLFKRLDELKKTYGYSLFKDTMFFLNGLKENKLISLGNKVKLMDLLIEHHIDEIDLMKEFLGQIIEIHDFHSIVIKLEEIQKEYGIDSVYLRLNTLDSYNIVPVFHSNHHFQRAFFPKDVIPFSKIDFKSGEIQLAVAPHYEYIIDRKERGKHERIFCTRDFRFASRAFPSKDEMNLYNFRDEKKKWMSYIISHLAYLDNIDLYFVLDDPNFQMKDFYSNNIDVHYTILTDGLLFDINEREVWSRSGYFESLFVRDASVFMVCEIKQDVISKVQLIVDPIYFTEYMMELDQSHEKGLLENVSFLLKKSREDHLRIK